MRRLVAKTTRCVCNANSLHKLNMSAKHYNQTQQQQQ